MIAITHSKYTALHYLPKQLPIKTRAANAYQVCDANALTYYLDYSHETVATSKMSRLTQHHDTRHTVLTGLQCFERISNSSALSNLSLVISHVFVRRRTASFGESRTVFSSGTDLPVFTKFLLSSSRDGSLLSVMPFSLSTQFELYRNLRLNRNLLSLSTRAGFEGLQHIHESNTYIQTFKRTPMLESAPDFIQLRSLL